MSELVWFEPLHRVDFYCSDWIGATRMLSAEQRGVYFDILMLMYGRGGPVKHDMEHLRKYCGYKQVRTINKVVETLIEDGKLQVIEGHLVSNRAQKELEKAHEYITNGKTGGRGNKKKTTNKQDINKGKTGNKSSINDQLMDDKEAISDPGIEEKQLDSKNPSSPSPSPKEKDIPDGISKDPDPDDRFRVDLASKLLAVKFVQRENARMLVDGWLDAGVPGSWLAETIGNAALMGEKIDDLRERVAGLLRDTGATEETGFDSWSKATKIMAARSVVNSSTLPKWVSADDRQKLVRDGYLERGSNSQYQIPKPSAA